MATIKDALRIDAWIRS